MATDHNIRQLIINKVPTKAQYDQMVKNADELYLTPDDSNGLPDQTGQSGKFLKTNGTNASWDNVPAGTVTSVRVQATSPVQSSTSTAQSTTLNTTISLANGYGDTKNPYGTKTANYVLAGPSSGSAAAPTFRALEKTDIPLASETAASGGTTTSLVTTGEKYTWNSKQDALTTQTAYSAKGSATKVPQITTNTLGQVTKIEEVTITQPTVNDSTITIQKNSTTVDSFTTNAASAKTINITVPTKTSDLTNDSGYTTNTGTVTSVQVQAGTGLTSSTSTAQTTSLNTTIGVDSNYKLPTTTEWNGKQDTISDLGYIRNKVALVDDKISGVDITNSGSSLPATTSYSVGDTFLNTTDNKLYTTEAPAWQLNSGVSKPDSITVNLTTGVATGFFTTSNPGGTSFNTISNSYQKTVTSEPIYIHFKTGSTIPTYGFIFTFSTQVTYYQQYIGVQGNSNSQLFLTCFTYYNGNLNTPFSYQLFDISLEPNTEYYLYITHNGSEYISTISSTGYNTNIIETSTIEESSTQYGTTMYYGGALSRMPTYNGMSIYLADSTGDFLLADGSLTWDSGTILEDNTQYNDTTNEKTYYYNNSILYEAGDGLPDQTGQSGKYLTTDGTSASWATVQAGPKFLTFTNITASTWVSDNTYADYSYKCVLTCNGVTSSDYAQVIFNPSEADSGNYAALCLTDTNTVTIYSKVNNSITIPTIMVMGA